MGIEADDMDAYFKDRESTRKMEEREQEKENRKIYQTIEEEKLKRGEKLKEKGKERTKWNPFGERILNNESEEEFKQRLNDHMFNTPLQFINTNNMKERKYENALHYILGALSTDTLTVEKIRDLEKFIQEVLKEEEDNKTLIRG